MLRNDLILLLSQHGNDVVTVDVNGILIDIESTTTDRGNIVIQLEHEDVTSVLLQTARAGHLRATEPRDETVEPRT